MNDKPINQNDYAPIFKSENDEEMHGDEIELDEEDEVALDAAWEQLRKEMDAEQK